MVPWLLPYQCPLPGRGNRRALGRNPEVRVDIPRNQDAADRAAAGEVPPRHGARVRFEAAGCHSEVSPYTSTRFP